MSIEDSIKFDENDEIPCFHIPDYKLTLQEKPKFNTIFNGIFISNQTFEDMDEYKEQKIYEIRMIRMPHKIIHKSDSCIIVDRWYKISYDKANQRPYKTKELEIPIYWRYLKR